MNLLHLSPSSLKDWERCPYRFKLMRLEDKKIEIVPTLNMDVGTVFDAHIKCRLNRRLRIDELLKKVKNEKAIELGAVLANIYDQSGALQALIDEGVGQVEIDKETLVNGVPLYGKPDYTMSDGSIGDWKISLSGSPKPGYQKRREFIIGLQTVKIEEPHNRQFDNLEQIDSDWAVQLTCYSFLLGRKPMNGLRCRIENVVLQSNKVVIASYNNTIGLDFQYYVWNLLAQTWESIQKMEIPLPQYSEHRCWAYGRKCEVAEKCPAFKEMGEKRIDDDPTLLLGAFK